MNKPRLQTRQYYFSVEGETERWYLEWLQRKINENGSCRVNFVIKIEKSPIKFVRGLNILQRTDIWHLCDYESDEEVHVKQFNNAMDEMKKAQSQKQVTYHLGYSNLAFDLWIILHRTACNGGKVHRSKYISDINKAYHKNFEDMHQYKHEQNFQQCLDMLTLDDVRKAIRRAKVIMQKMREKGAKLQTYKGFNFYKENPSLAVYEIIEKLLVDCELS